MWQTVPERRTGSSERSVANSTTMSARHVELRRRRGPQTSPRRDIHQAMFCAVYMCSIGMKTSKQSKLLWFFNVGLSGKNGLLHYKWKVKTLETLLKENKHIDV